MKVLRYNDLDLSGIQDKYEKVIEKIRQDDFYSAQVKKLGGTPYFRAMLDSTNRLLFKVVDYQGQKYALILEIIRNHAYEKSRFLNGAKVEEGKIEEVESLQKDTTLEKIPYLNNNQPQFHILDKIISFDDLQNEIFHITPPVIIIGSAGSGKTMLTLEKMKTCTGEILYTTHSSYLIQNAQELYYAQNYSNEYQNTHFLSYKDLLETIRIPMSKELTFQDFSSWLHKMNARQEVNKLYEEFKGVISGNVLEKPYWSREEYINLGIKQSVYKIEERSAVYDLFEKYLFWLKNQALYDINLLSFDYLTLCQPQYDFIVIDEVQDFTLVQLSLILKMAKAPNQFILCGDSNQIVHPNFFSWSKIKSLFYKKSNDDLNFIRVLSKNYRNTLSTTNLANKILKIKTARFGSLDRESHYLIESQNTNPGEIYCLLNTDNVRQEINKKTSKSAKFAVITLREEQKKEAAQQFQTPLIFSIREAKGLEYDNVILYNFVSSEAKCFNDIACQLTAEDLKGDLRYNRVKDKSDRSLEIYKFYINGLYVAITRAVKNIYFIENIENHSLFNLLALKPNTEVIALDHQESSLSEWQKEAARLELQGKQEQAEAIKHQVLKQQKTPWEPLTTERIEILKEKALNPDNKDKEARLLLLEYAQIYHDTHLITALQSIGFATANKRNDEVINRKYFMNYTSNNPTGIMRLVNLYGSDFRNIFNQTPLMIACAFGNQPAITQLIENGANPSLTDNLGRNAFQIALQKAILDQKFAQTKLLTIYNTLSTANMALQVDNKLIKVDIKKMEFFLINLMIAMAHQKNQHYFWLWSFKVDDFLYPLMHFPEMLLPENRKRRAYISSVLSRNEVARVIPYNRKLFLRIQRGHYIFNPGLTIKLNEQWVNIYTLLGLENLKNQYLEVISAHVKDVC